MNFFLNFFCSDTSPFSLVGTDSNNQILGFAAFGTAPPSWIDGSDKFVEDKNKNELEQSNLVSDVSKSNWSQFISHNWDSKDLTVLKIAVNVFLAIQYEIHEVCCL